MQSKTDAQIDRAIEEKIEQGERRYAQSLLRGEKLCCYQQANYAKGARYDELMDRAAEIVNEINALEGGR